MRNTKQYKATEEKLNQQNNLFAEKNLLYFQKTKRYKSHTNRKRNHQRSEKYMEKRHQTYSQADWIEQEYQKNAKIN